MCDRLLALILLVAVVSSVALASPTKNSTALPLSEILGKLDAKYVAVSEVSFDDGVWEIEAERDQQSVEVRIGPASGAFLSERPDGPHLAPPPDALPLTKVVRQLEETGYGLIREIDLKGAVWDVETSRNGSPRELTVDVRTGKVLADRADD